MQSSPGRRGVAVGLTPFAFSSRFVGEQKSRIKAVVMGDVSLP